MHSYYFSFINCLNYYVVFCFILVRILNIICSILLQLQIDLGNRLHIILTCTKQHVGPITNTFYNMQSILTRSNVGTYMQMKVSKVSV